MKAQTVTGGLEKVDFIIADARIVICKKLSLEIAIDIEKEIKELFPSASTHFSSYDTNGDWRDHSPSGVIFAYEIRLPIMPAAKILELARYAERLGLQLSCKVYCQIEWVRRNKSRAGTRKPSKEPVDKLT